MRIVLSLLVAVSTAASVALAVPVAGAAAPIARAAVAAARTAAPSARAAASGPAASRASGVRRAPGRPSGVDVAIATSAGTFVVRIATAKAPNTSRNFLRYVDTKAYDGSSFYRTVARKNEPQAPFEVIQGGLDPHGPNGNVPIALERTATTGLHNVDGAIAMARTNDPNSATTEFFVDLGDARYLDAGGPLGPGYAVFGRVVRGMAVVRRIHDGPSQGEALTPPVRILTMRRV